MLWLLIIEEFGPNIQHISGVDNMVSDTLRIFSYTSVDKYESSTSKTQCCANKLLKIGRVENNKERLPLNILNMQR